MNILRCPVRSPHRQIFLRNNPFFKKIAKELQFIFENNSQFVRKSAKTIYLHQLFVQITIDNFLKYVLVRGQRHPIIILL